MIDVTILPELGENCPQIALGHIACNVNNTKYDSLLWAEINIIQEKVRSEFTFAEVKEQENIAETRKVYKACGKDPHRYRPSAESLFRRIIKNNDLYQINTLVDLVNLFSLESGYSIGGFDADKIVGKITAGVGKKGEPYNGIGRGEINIEGMPVIRDEIGGIGTPTSDEERTALCDNTTSFFMNINGYTGTEKLYEFMDYAEKSLRKYVNASNIERQIVNYNGVI